MIFDCLDYRLTFDARPISLKLPEIDRLTREAFTATQAFPPSRETLLSLPSLLIGDAFADAQPASASDLKMKRLQGGNILWSEAPTVFSKAKQLGAKTGLIGWYHPYDRIIGSNLDFTYVYPNQLYTRVKALLENPFKSLMTPFPILRQQALPSPRLFLADSIADHAERYRSLFKETTTVLNQRQVDLLVVHWSIPHPWGIYRRDTGRLDSRRSSYLDNLALMDRTLGEIRRSMESSGAWNSTAIIVTSDHWWRSEIWKKQRTWTPEDQWIATAEKDKRVPLIIRMPGHRRHMEYTQPISNILTAELALAILRGDLTTAGQIPDWMKRHPAPITQPVPDPYGIGSTGDSLTF